MNMSTEATRFFKKASKKSNVAVEANYGASEMIAKSRKPFKDSEFIKQCI